MFKQLRPEGLVLITPPRFSDGRGFFQETYVTGKYADAGIKTAFVQDNQSLSRGCGVIRGLHFQGPPTQQAKLVRCSFGAIYDVAVDLRPDSPTYGGHVGVELSADTGAQLYIPTGFAHGFCTLTEETLVDYKVSAPYAPDCEGGIYWNDPELGIEWPVDSDAAVLSDKDQALPRMSALDNPFAVNG